MSSIQLPPELSNRSIDDLLTELRSGLARDALQSLAVFVREAWQLVEPANPLRWNWHHDELCAILEDVYAGKIKRLIINIPPGTSKPVHVDELVYTDRGFVRLGDVEVGDSVLTHKGRFRLVLEVHDQGVLPTVRIKTFCGREVRTALDHPFLTPRGWIKAQDLTTHDYVGFPRRTEDLRIDKVTEHEARLLGYLVGDGCINSRSLSFTNADQEIIDDFIHCAKLCGFHAYITKHPNPNVKATQVALKSSEVKWARMGKHSVKDLPVLEWIKKHGLYKCDSYTKSIPPMILASSSRMVANFVGAYWSCDGTFAVRHTNNKTTMLSSATTVSERLAQDLLRALSVLNISCRLRTHKVRLQSKKQPGGIYTSYNIQTTARNEVAKFINMPGLCSVKNSIARKSFLDRFEPEIYADAVESVERVEDGHCKCLTVEDDESFTINNLVVHNSLIASVFFNAWVWANDASKRFLTASYTIDLTLRDNRRLRDIVRSEWYVSNYNVQLKVDAKERFETTQAGFRVATSVRGFATGEHPNYIIIDDPLKADDARSDVARYEANSWIDNTISTRLALDPAIILIMQRLHEDDPSGHLLEKGGWEHVVLPMRYESRKVDEHDPRNIPDPHDHRTVEGELLWPEVWPESKVQQEELLLGLAASGQLGQRPVPEGGTLIDRDMLEYVDIYPDDVELCRGWDIAETDAKEKTAHKANWTVGTKVGYCRRTGTLYIIDNVRAQETIVDDLILSTAHMDGVRCKVREGSGSGKATTKARSILLAGYDYDTSPETESKTARAKPFISQCKFRNVKIVRGPWNAVYVSVICSFPLGKCDDDMDSTSNAVNELLSTPVEVKKTVMTSISRIGRRY